MIEKQNIHFIGIRNRNECYSRGNYEKKFNITGSDITKNLITKRLKQKD